MTHQMEKLEKLPKCFKYLLSKVYYDGQIYNNIITWYDSLKEKSGQFTVILNPKISNRIKITVARSAMVDSPFYSFNQIYNDNKPIPKEVMIGTKIDERDNMIKMDLWDESHKIHWSGWILKSKILKQEEV